jgi:tetratricopeptide (TPR) repeat protein
MDAETRSTEFYVKVVGWIYAHRKPLLIGAIVVAAIGLVVAFLAWKANHDEAEAQALFFAVPIEGGARAAPPSPMAFLDVAQKYSGTAAGEHAQLLGAELLFTQGKYAEAGREFAHFIDEHPSDELVPQAKVGLAASVEAEGKIMDAIQKYHEIILAYPGDANIVSPTKLTVARLCEEANQPQQALTYYVELARMREQNPYDPWAAEAQERARLLLAKHPELARSQTSAAPAGFSVSEAAKAAASVKAPEAKAVAANPATNLLSIPGAAPKTAAKP